MDEHPPTAVQTPLLTPEGHEPEGGVDYTPGIEHALDGYAPDRDSWLHARDIFMADLAEYGSVDAAARVALASVEEGAEAPYEEAETKFWDYIEGENGPHACYGAAINDALDGYAPDDESWLSARDIFFGSIRQGAAIEEALGYALETVTEGTESTPDDAAERFWGDVHHIEQEESERNAAIELRREQLQSYNPHISEVRASEGYGLEAVPISSEEAESERSWHRENRMLALELAPQSRERELGIDVARVDRFLESKGLQPRPALLLTRNDIEVYAAKLARQGYTSKGLDALARGGTYNGVVSPTGVYLPSLGIIIIAVDGASEVGLDEQGRAAYLEALLVHEEAHSTETASENELVSINERKGFWPSRNGSSISRVVRGEDSTVESSREGEFFEEGFAEMLAGEYVRDELGLPNGVWQNQRHPGFHTDPMLSAVGGEHVWPGLERGSFGFATAAFAATGMRLLINQRPDLYQAFINSRESVEGLRDIAKIVNSVEPGLYVKLRKLQYNDDGFKAGLAAIQRAIQ